jgi:hypothetical protein
MGKKRGKIQEGVYVKNCAIYMAYDYTAGITTTYRNYFSYHI